MSAAERSGLTGRIRGQGDPRLKMLWYFAWYSVLWLTSVKVLILLFGLQVSLGIAMRIFRGTTGRAIVIVVYVGLVLTAISIWIGNETAQELIVIWCCWGVIVLATFNLAAGMELREIFVALNTFRVPQTFVFTLGIALTTIPLVGEEIGRISFARLTWGHRQPKGLHRITGAVKTLWGTLVPTLLGIIVRAEKMWFTIELRGLRYRLYRPLPKARQRALDAMVIVSGFVPVASLLLLGFV